MRNTTPAKVTNWAVDAAAKQRKWRGLLVHTTSCGQYVFGKCFKLASIYKKSHVPNQLRILLFEIPDPPLQCIGCLVVAMVSPKELTLGFPDWLMWLPWRLVTAHRAASPWAWQRERQIFPWESRLLSHHTRYWSWWRRPNTGTQCIHAGESGLHLDLPICQSSCRHCIYKIQHNLHVLIKFNLILSTLWNYKSSQTWVEKIPVNETKRTLLLNQLKKQIFAGANIALNVQYTLYTYGHHAQRLKHYET